MDDPLLAGIDLDSIVLRRGITGEPLPAPMQTLLKWCMKTGPHTRRDQLALTTLPDDALALLGTEDDGEGGRRPTGATRDAALLLWTSTDPEGRWGGEVRVTADDLIDATNGLVAAAALEQLRRAGDVEVLEARGGILAPQANWKVRFTPQGMARAEAMRRGA